MRITSILAACGLMLTVSACAMPNTPLDTPMSAYGHHGASHLRDIHQVISPAVQPVVNEEAGQPLLIEAEKAKAERGGGGGGSGSGGGGGPPPAPDPAPPEDDGGGGPKRR